MFIKKRVSNNFIKGFTLIEVLLVVILFSVAAAAIFPNFKQFYAKSVFDSNLQRILKTFEYARTRAMIENAFLRLSLDLDERSFVLEIKNETALRGIEFMPLSGKFGKINYLPDEVNFGNSSTREIFFNPDGSVEKYKIILHDVKREKVIKGKGYFGVPEITEEKV
ncbi:Tfp pilus assembly protein FimT/FimU [Candidatus Omnitrophota bacterium]